MDRTILAGKSAIVIGSISEISNLIAAQIKLMGADVYVSTLDNNEFENTSSEFNRKDSEDYLIVLIKTKVG